MEMIHLARTGRPKGTNNKDIICSMRMDAATKSRLEEYCKKMDMAKSEALRHAIDLLAEEAGN